MPDTRPGECFRLWKWHVPVVEGYEKGRCHGTQAWRSKPRCPFPIVGISLEEKE